MQGQACPAFARGIPSLACQGTAARGFPPALEKTETGGFSEKNVLQLITFILQTDAFQEAYFGARAFRRNFPERELTKRSGCFKIKKEHLFYSKKDSHPPAAVQR